MMGWNEVMHNWHKIYVSRQRVNCIMLQCTKLVRKLTTHLGVF
jgi:hypothetical protein